jgi:hypothetical protein
LANVLCAVSRGSKVWQRYAMWKGAMIASRGSEMMIPR